MNTPPNNSSSHVLLANALHYAENWGFAVFPVHSIVNEKCTCGDDNCHSPGKHPYTRNGVNDAATDAGVIRAWWTLEFPGANIGIATGDKSSVCVVDEDAPGAFQHLIAAVPPSAQIATVTAKTGRIDCFHYYFRPPKNFDVRNSAGKLGKNLDVRGNGGYVVAPPSIHFSGNFYDWLPDHTDIMDFPVAWLDLLKQPIGARKNPNSANPANGKKTLIARDVLPNQNPNVVGVGERNAVLASLAGKLRRYGFGQDSIEASLLIENKRICQPPLTDDEVIKIARSISRYAPSVTPPTARIFELTDKGNGERLAHRHGADLRFCSTWNSWLWWNGMFWERSKNGEVMQRAKETVENIPFETGHSSADLTKHCFRAQSAKSIHSMIELAKSESPVPVDENGFDQNVWLLNCANGTLDLKNREFYSHERTHLITRGINHDYDPNAKCPHWVAFLEKIFDRDAVLIKFVRRALGYTLCGDISERKIFICYGIGRNGKSTLLDVWQHILGEYALRTPTETLIANKNDSGISNDIARLRGARFAFAAESDEGKKLKESFIKDLTGGDTITARFMRAEFFQFKPECKIWFATNHKPRIYGTDEGIWDRIVLIPFLVRILENEIDKSLPEKLKREAEGILAWAMQGFFDWQENGLGVPASVTAATREYRQENDLVGQFLTEKCELGDGLQVAVAKLYEAYELWSKENTGYAASKILFGKRLRERGFHDDRDSDTNRTRIWKGVNLIYTGAPQPF